jgi:uncharacterized lipoprotein YddW (UPF0748 family)
MFRRRPPLRIALVLVAVLVVVAVLGLGLLRAATYDPPSPTAAASGPASRPPVIGPAAGAVGRCGSAPARATRELRGMWLTTVLNIDFPSRPGLSEAQVKKEYDGWLDLAVAQRHNAIFVHVRPSGDAFWPSARAPWSQWLTGRFDGAAPGWDPMAYMVTGAHARNIEFHAWFNPYRGTEPGPDGAGADLRKLSPGNALLQHPDWRISYPTGAAARLYFDPGIPDARAYVEEAMLEAVRKYDVDGVHFDDFFYPYPENDQDFPDSASYARFGAGKSRGDWRRDNVDTLVREMSQKIKVLKPWVKFGISPFGIWRNTSDDPSGSDSHGLSAYDAIYADTRKWVREGWLDYIVPQLYWNIGFAKADFAKLLPWWATLVQGSGVQLWIGEADYRVGEKGAWSDPGQLDRQLALNDRYGVQGQVHFSAASIRDDKLGAVTRYRNRHYAAPALIPTMKQLPAAPPPAPRLVASRRSAGGLRFDAEAGPAAVSWALYRTAGGPAALVATGRAGAPVADPHPLDTAAGYCLSGLDRSGNEGALSDPLQVPAA